MEGGKPLIFFVTYIRFLFILIIHALIVDEYKIRALLYLHYIHPLFKHDLWEIKNNGCFEFQAQQWIKGIFLDFNTRGVNLKDTQFDLNIVCLFLHMYYTHIVHL